MSPNAALSNNIYTVGSAEVTGIVCGRLALRCHKFKNQTAYLLRFFSFDSFLWCVSHFDRMFSPINTSPKLTLASIEWDGNNFHSLLFKINAVSKGHIYFVYFCAALIATHFRLAIQHSSSGIKPKKIKKQKSKRNGKIYSKMNE